MLLLLRLDAATTVLILGHLLLEGAGEGDGVVGGGPGHATRLCLSGTEWLSTVIRAIQVEGDRSQ